MQPLWTQKEWRPVLKDKRDGYSTWWKWEEEVYEVGSIARASCGWPSQGHLSAQSSSLGRVRQVTIQGKRL